MNLPEEFSELPGGVILSAVDPGAVNPGAVNIFDEVARVLARRARLIDRARLQSEDNAQASLAQGSR